MITSIIRRGCLEYFRAISLFNVRRLGWAFAGSRRSLGLLLLFLLQYSLLLGFKAALTLIRTGFECDQIRTYVADFAKVLQECANIFVIQFIW